MRAKISARKRHFPSGWVCFYVSAESPSLSVAKAKNVPEIMQRIRKWIEKGTK